MSKTKLYKLIFIIAIYSAAFTLLLISIKNYTTYLCTYKNDSSFKSTVLSTNSSKKQSYINITSKDNNFINNNKYITEKSVFSIARQFASHKNKTTYTAMLKNNPCKPLSYGKKSLQKKLAKNVLRFHVIANSDSEHDQNLKLKVRDSILNELRAGLNQATSPAQAKQYTASHFEQIKNTAIYTIRQNGYSYSVKVFIQNRYFPLKTYGDLTFPAGYYDALCVEIGKADGHNWWCVLFPSLCFEDATTATVPNESKAKLKENLTTKEYDSLATRSSVKNNTRKNSYTTQKSAPNARQKTSKRKNVQIRSGLYELFLHSGD